MQTAPLPSNEEERLEALRQTGILDTGPEESFDRLTDLAAKVCGVPIALITLVDVDRQWFKSHVGLDVMETPRDVAICAHAILEPRTMIVPDTLQDARFADNPLVTEDPKIRFYAGSPMVTHDGNALGTFCVIDMIPRDLDPEQVEALETLAHHATVLLELRRAKELLSANAHAWEQAGAEGDMTACAEALERLGDNFKQLVEAREQAEHSFRELERNLGRIAPRTVLTGRGVPLVDHLLGEIQRSSERMLNRFGREHPLRAEATRIAACARRAHELLMGDRPRN